MLSVSPGVTATLDVTWAPSPPLPGSPQSWPFSLVQPPPAPPAAPNPSRVSCVTPSGTTNDCVPPVKVKLVGLVAVAAVPLPEANPIANPPANTAAAASRPNLRIIRALLPRRPGEDSRNRRVSPAPGP